MGGGTPASENPPSGGHATDPGPDQGPLPPPQTQTGATLNIGRVLVQTLRHFFPDLNKWIDDIPDPRFLPFVIYASRFLFWWGISLFLFKLGSRRQLDFQ